MPTTETTKDVPEDKVEQVMSDYKDAGATKVEKTKQADGKWTIVATFPDSAAETAKTDGDGKKAKSNGKKTEGRKSNKRGG